MEQNSNLILRINKQKAGDNMSRQNGGRETWDRLLNWDRGQADSERLAAHILKSEDYESIDPSHPLGGPDGGKDLICQKDGLKIIGACYFPRGQQSFGVIKSKYASDLDGVINNKADGIAFITNQEMTLSQRKELSDLGNNLIVEVYHLERIANILDSPINYGIRLDFLDIDITKEEMLSFQAERDKEYYNKMEKVNSRLDEVLSKINESVNDLIGFTDGGDSFGYISLANIYNDPDVKNIVFLHEGKYPLYNIHIRICDLDKQFPFSIFSTTINESTPESSTMLDFKIDLHGIKKKKYNIFYSARNGFFNQLLRLYKVNGEWVAATRILNEINENTVFEAIDMKLDQENIDWN